MGHAETESEAKRLAAFGRELVGILGESYPAWKATSGTWLVFARVLQGLDRDACLAAAWKWVREQKFPPAPADMLALATEFQKYLDRGPDNAHVHLRLDGMDYAFGPSDLEALVDGGLPELRQAIAERTRKTVEEHLEAWRKTVDDYKGPRRQALRRLASGDWSQAADLPPMLTMGSRKQESEAL